MACYANGSHRQSSSFPISDGKSLSRPYMEKHNSVLRWLHYPFLELLKNTLSDFERSSNASNTGTQKSIHLSFSDNMCFPHVILLVKMEFKPIQVKHQLSASIQYWNRLLRLKVSCASVLKTDGTFAILPKLLELHQLTKENERIRLEPRSPPDFWTAQDVASRCRPF